VTQEVKALDNANEATALMSAFEAYKQTNDERLAEIEAKGASDPLIDEKLRKLDRRLDSLSLKAARPDEGVAGSTTLQNDAWSQYMRRGDESGISQLDTKAYSAGTEDQGGYLAPPELDRLIEGRLMQSSPMRQIATVRQTMAGTYRKPVSLGVGAQWTGETTVRAQTSTAGLSLLEFPAGELYAMPAATQTLLDDAYTDVDAWLAEEVETAFSVQVASPS